MKETTEKLPTSPDWSQYPDSWKWFAIDLDGMGVLYEYKPFKDNAVYCQNGGEYFEIGRHFDPTNWETSLQKRPD